MIAPTAVVRSQARQDISSYTLWLRQEADVETSVRFAHNAIATFAKLAGSPMIGPRVSTRNPRLSGLRKWRVEQFPKLLIFYTLSSDSVEIVRVLHAAQDWWSLLDAD